MLRTSLIVMLLGVAGARSAAGQHCPPDSSKRDTVRATLSLAPGVEAANKETERNVYLLVAQAVAQHFVAPPTIKFSGWPGTFCRRPGNADGVDTDCFGLGGFLEFNLDTLGRLTADPVRARSASSELNHALIVAFQDASAAGDLPVPTRRMLSSKQPLTLTIRSSTGIMPQTVPFVRTRMVALTIDVPPTVTKVAKPVYPALPLSMGVSGRVGVEFVIDTAGVAEPGSITITEANYSDFVAASVKAIRDSRYHPGTVEGCPVRTLVRTAVVFKNR